MSSNAIMQLLQQALAHHQAGRLQDANRLYRQVLAQQPDQADALHLLGALASQVGKPDDAIALIRRAVESRPDFPEAHSNLGNVLKDQGRFDESIAAYRQAIACKFNFPEAHSNLGVALALNEQPDEAVAAFRQALTLRPNYPQACNNLGGALKNKGQLDEAITAYRQAIALGPNIPEAHNNLGDALNDKGQTDEAITAYRQAIACKFNYPEAHSNLGGALVRNGQLDEAVAACRQALALRPNYPQACNNLGGALKNKGQLDEAVAAYRQAIALRPDFPEAHNNLGNALCDRWQVDEAISSYRQAIACKFNYPEAHSNLATALARKGQLDEAVAACQQALALRPHFAQAFNSLGVVLQNKGQLDEAITAYRQAIASEPGMVRAHSNLVYALHFHPGYDSRAIAAEHRRWDEQHTKALNLLRQPHPNTPDPERRLRVGYVSPDFRDHVVGRNLLPLFQQHNRQHHEITCYSQVVCADAMTARFQQLSDRWRDSVGASDEQMARQIREDGIDILVDLTLHMEGNRLLVFARKAAPVQVTFAGYPASTGLGAIDYRLSDPYLDPVGHDESVYSERTLRLPDSFWCYEPEAQDPAVNSLPARETGVVTFGCLNNFCKINPVVLELWAQVLRQLENSRLLLLAKQGSHRQQTMDFLARLGIGPGRVEFLDPRVRPEYLKLYHRIDLGLDSFPYNGHTTSLDSLWMGVPVVTLVGQTAVSRAGLSQLSNLGLEQLAARSPEQFVRIAADLANDLPRLQHLRMTLRDRMQTSPLTDAPRFARNVESAYRQMWREFASETSTPQMRPD